MSSQVVKRAENSRERFVRRFGDDSDVDYPLAIVKNPYIGDTLGVSNIVIDNGASDDAGTGGREDFDPDKSLPGVLRPFHYLTAHPVSKYNLRSFSHSTPSCL